MGLNMFRFIIPFPPERSPAGAPHDLFFILNNWFGAIVLVLAASSFTRYKSWKTASLLNMF